MYPDNVTANINGVTYTLNRKPDRGFSYPTSYPTSIFTSQTGYEVRRSKSRRPKRTFDLSYNNVSGIVKIMIENFYRDKLGETESFDFDLTHLGLSGIIRVRFSGTITVKEVFSTLDPETSVYSLSFTLEETYT